VSLSAREINWESVSSEHVSRSLTMIWEIFLEALDSTISRTLMDDPPLSVEKDEIRKDSEFWVIISL
jgi:hypothetical protein